MGGPEVGDIRGNWGWVLYEVGELQLGKQAERGWEWLVGGFVFIPELVM